MVSFGSLIPRSSHRLVFDHLQYVKMEEEEEGPGKFLSHNKRCQCLLRLGEGVEGSSTERITFVTFHALP